MINRSKDELTCECNDCGEPEYAGTLEFKDFIEDLKKKGWKIKKNGEQWEHYCPDCSEFL